MTELFSFLQKDELLSSALKFIYEYNKSNNNGYHNNTHLTNAFITSMKICDDGIDEVLNNEDIIEIGIASLFHDFNHSGGKLSDKENITLAIDGVSKFYNENFQLFHEKGLNIKKIYNLIEVTEFPYKRDPETIQEKIMRDADMFECYNENWFNNIVIGFLHNELGLSIIDSINNQIKFIENIKFYTPFTLYIHNELNLLIKQQLSSYLKIFNE